MTPEERAIEVLANALNGASVGPYRELPPPDEYFALYARSVWSRMDHDALRSALLAGVRREVEELTTYIDLHAARLTLDRDDVLRLLGDQEDPL